MSWRGTPAHHRLTGPRDNDTVYTWQMRSASRQDGDPGGSWRNGASRQNGDPGDSWRNGASRQNGDYAGNWRGSANRQNGHYGKWRGSDNDDDCFVIMPCSRFQGKAQELEPRVVGSYSVDSERNVLFDNSKMLFLTSQYIPDDNKCLEVSLDLNTGWNRVNGYTGTYTEAFRHFLQWILKNKKQLKSEDSADRLKFDMLCRRGLLSHVLKVPYEGYHNRDFTILAQMFKGSIYMVLYDENEEAKAKEKLNLLEIYGHKFEQYMTRGDPEDVVECNEQFRCVLNLHVNELSLLFNAVTDGIDESLHQSSFKDMKAFVSIKCKMEKQNMLKQTNFKKYVLNKWWAGNLLAGIPRVIMGMRNKDGIIHTLQTLPVADIPAMAEGEWEPSVCINFLDKFLMFVKEKVTAAPDKIHCFQRSERDVIHHYHDTKGRYVLPEWYKERLFASEEHSDSSEED